MTDLTERKMVLEQRIIAMMFAILMAVGGWWLQNQWEVTMETQRQISDLLKHTDSKYVQKEFLREITEDQRDRLLRVENKIDALLRQSGSK